MLEKRTMWVVWKNYPQDEPETSTVFIDSESNEVQFYGDDELSKPNGMQRFYNTEEEAYEGRVQIKHEIMDKMPEVKEYLNIMNCVRQDEDENSFFRFKYEDFLGCFAYRVENYNKYSYSSKEYEELDNMVDMLTDYIHTGFLNIRADSFKLEDVEVVKWGSKRAEIVLKNGKNIQTCNRSEYTFIEKLFGTSRSGYGYTHLDKKEDEDK
jgi:hypothetical protein